MFKNTLELMVRSELSNVLINQNQKLIRVKITKQVQKKHQRNERRNVQQFLNTLKNIEMKF